MKAGRGRGNGVTEGQAWGRWGVGRGAKRDGWTDGMVGNQ